MSELIRILIVDDHPIVRRGLRTLLDEYPDVQVVGEAGNGAEAVKAVQAMNPQIVLMDLSMPVMSGVEAASIIRHQFPLVRILALSSFAGNDQIFPAIKAGASGYLLKECEPAELMKAIRDVYAGRPALHPKIANRILQHMGSAETQSCETETLTEREVEVLRCLAHGQNNGEIAQALFISEHTVSAHVGNILDKLHLSNRTQAALYALRSGLVGLFND